MSKKISDLYPKLMEATRRWFPPGQDVVLPSEQVSKVFDELEHEFQPYTRDLLAFGIRFPEESIRKLLSTGTDQALEYVKYALDSSRAESQQGAVDTLGLIKNETGLGLLEYALQSHIDRNARSMAAYYLCRNGDRTNEIIARSIADEKPDVREATIGGIYTFFINLRQHWRFEYSWEPENEHQKYLVRLLRKALVDSHPEVKRRTIDLLTTIHQITIEDLDRALLDDNPSVRVEAITDLFRIENISKPICYQLIARALEDRLNMVSQATLDGLKRNGIKLELEPFITTLIDRLVIRASDQSEVDFNPTIVNEVIQLAIQISPRIRNQVISRLCDLAFENTDGVRRRSALLGARVDEGEFLALVSERAGKNPVDARAIMQLIGGGLDTTAIADQISQAEPGDIQAIAASQIRLLDNYYKDVLAQANISFRWAIGVTVASLICLIITLIYLLNTPTHDITTILTSTGSIFAQFIAATQFYLYEQTRKQLAYFHQQLNLTERFLLANSVCESLEGEGKQKARMELVSVIAKLNTGADNLSIPIEKK